MFLNRTGFRGGKSGNNGIRRIVLICLAILLGWFGWSLASTVRVLTQALGISVGTAISWMLKDFSFFFGELFSVKSLQAMQNANSANARTAICLAALFIALPPGRTDRVRYLLLPPFLRR